MSFAVHEEFFDHPKLDPIRRDAYWWGLVLPLWAAAGCDARKRLTDGLVPRARLGDLPGPLSQADRIKAAEKLVELELWERVGTDYRFHDWADCQETKAEVQDRRARNRERKRAYREKVAHALALASQGDARGEAARSPVGTDGVTPEVTPAGRPAVRPGVGREWERSGDLSLSEDLSERGAEEQPGLRVIRRLQETPLVNIATGFAYSRWRKDWDALARRPEAELESVIRTLLAHPHWTKRWQQLNPGHLDKHWVTYVAGRLPAYSANADAADSSNNGRPSRFGMSEVSKPEEFVEDDV